MAKKEVKKVGSLTEGKKEIIGKVSKEDIKKIAEIKLEDLNAYDIESAMKSVEGSALNMGIEVK